MSRLVDLSPAVLHGFKRPPSTSIGVQLDVRVKRGYWQSAQATLSCHTGCHVRAFAHVEQETT
jgi:arylformamidase